LLGKDEVSAAVNSTAAQGVMPEPCSSLYIGTVPIFSSEYFSMADARAIQNFITMKYEGSNRPAPSQADRISACTSSCI